MSIEQWRLVQTIVEQALALEGNEQTQFVLQSTADEEVKAHVQQLLAQQSELGDFLELPLFNPDIEVLDPSWIGRQIGPYLITDDIGEGGMARVYRAVRNDGAFAREVAIKVVHASHFINLESRFEIERQILAGLEHRHIARLLDAGRLDSRPYAVIELVAGKRLTDYCFQQRLDLTARLNLFLNVCDAVHYAHKELVVHLDLKPSNILVTETGEVKLLDFGIASLLAGSADRLIINRCDWALTPNYASPEQMAGHNASITMDIYSLGVLLYEICSGTRPYDWSHRDLAALTVSDWNDYAAPSARVCASANYPKSQGLDSDLDSVVLKAMHFEAAQRYQSVDHLAEDLRRYLSGHAVKARPLSLLQRLRKLVGRHPVQSAIGFAAFIVIAVLSSFGVNQARQTTIERDQARAVSQYLIGAFDLANPVNTDGNQISAREILDQTAKRLQAEVDLSPDLTAELKETMGVVYRGLGHYDIALPFLEDAVKLRKREHGHRHQATAKSLLELSMLYRALGHLEDAKRTADESLNIYIDVMGTHHLSTKKAKLNAAEVNILQGDYDQAEKHAIDLLNALGPDSKNNNVEPDCLNIMVQVHWGRRDYEQAELAAREALRLREMRVGRGELAHAMSNLAAILVSRTKYAEAESLQLQSLEITKKLFGDQHPNITNGLNTLAFIYQQKGDFKKAEVMYLEALNRCKQGLGDQHPSLVSYLSNLAGLSIDNGNYETALDYYDQGIRLSLNIWPQGHEMQAQFYNGLGLALHCLANDEMAIASFEQALDIGRAVAGERSLVVGSSLGHQAISLALLGKIDQADQNFRQGLDILIEASGENSSNVASMRNNYADFLLAQKRPQDAWQQTQLAAAIYHQLFPYGHWRIAYAETVVGRVMAEQGHFNEGLAHVVTHHEELVCLKGDDTHASRLASLRLLELFNSVGDRARVDEFEYRLGALPVHEPLIEGSQK